MITIEGWCPVPVGPHVHTCITLLSIGPKHISETLATDHLTVQHNAIRAFRPREGRGGRMRMRGGNGLVTLGLSEY